MNEAVPVNRRPPPATRGGKGEGRAEGPKKPRAQSLVEFALIVPLLFLLTMGIIEFGWLFRNYMTVHYSTREGARTGAVAGDLGNADDQILQAISVSMQTMPYDDLLSVRVYKSPDCNPTCIANSYTRTHDPYPFSWVLDGASNWAAGSRLTTEPTDAIGVEIRFRHNFLVNLIPGAIGTTIIQDHSVVQIEPSFFGTPGP